MPFTTIMSIVWLVLAVAFAILEAATLGLTSIWFAAGSLIAMLAAMLGAQLWLQITLFILVTALSLIFTRKMAKEHFNKSTVKTNADRIVGMTGIVIEDIDNDMPSGQARIGGQIWTVRSEGGEKITVGHHVEVCAIAGVKAIVKLSEKS